MDRTIRVDGGQHVANRAVYTVLGLDPDGALRVRGTDGGIAHLPRRYVDEHLTLAYASTVHAAQGRTVTTCHALLDEAAAREAAYVALSRGREANYAYLVAQRDPDAHEPQRLDGTAAGRLAGVLGNVEARHAAEVERRIGERDGASLAWIGTQWDEVSKDAARARYADQLARVLEPDAVAALTAEPGLAAAGPRRARGRAGRPQQPTPCWPPRWSGRPLDDAAAGVGRAALPGAGPRRRPHPRAAGAGRALDRAGPARRRPGRAVRPRARRARRGPPARAGPGRARRPARRGRSPSWARSPATTSSPPGSRPGCRSRSRRSTRSRPPGSSGRSGPARSPPTGSCAASTREATSIGAAPSREEEFHRQMWTQANAALGRDVDPGAVDYRTLADLDLYAVRDRWTREQAWAPAYVAEEMRAAYQLGREYTEDAALAGARLAQLEPDDPAWEQTAAQLERSQRLADLNLERARQLDEIHHARGGWYDSTEDARVADELARAELERRGLPAQRELDRGEQLRAVRPDRPRRGPARPGRPRGRRPGRRRTRHGRHVEPALEAQPAHEAEVAAQAREPVDVERALEDAHAELAPTAERVAHDPRQVELHLEDGVELDDIELDDVELEQQNDAAQTPAPAAAASPSAPSPRPCSSSPCSPSSSSPGSSSSRCWRSSPTSPTRSAPSRCAHRSRTRPPSRRGTTPRTRSAHGRSRPGSPWPRRAGRPRPPTPSGKPGRPPRLPPPPWSRPCRTSGRRWLPSPRTAAQRARDEDAERQEQLTRWHEQDRADELDRGLDDGPSLGMG